MAGSTNNNWVAALVLAAVIAFILLVGYGTCDRQPENPIIPAPVKTNLREYTVQVGSFPTLAEANLLAAGLREKNIKNFVLQAGSQWLVCVGKFPSRERAHNMVRTLKEYGVDNAVVLPPSF
jgi:cell division septation protein DedD